MSNTLTSHSTGITVKTKPIVACYIRLSREDGDKTESLSIVNQRLKLTEYIHSHSELKDYEIQYYEDDGYTGTSFQRPAFLKLQRDIEVGTISAVVVKDLSRMGRNLSKVTELVQDYFPSRKVRFIAIDDNIDKQYYQLDTSEDMMIEVKNLFNGFYPKDISKKVRSIFRAKQQAGQFIGAFACYGYRKDPLDHNRLIVDEPASQIVKRIFNLYLAGMGQQTIAKLLNSENIPCPSEYKRQQGLKYHNGSKLSSTTYWTYSSIRNILRQRNYTGAMVQNTSFRQMCKKKAIKLPKDQWLVVKNTHEAIIDESTFEKVQKLLSSNTRETHLTQSTHIYAGLIRCGDCGRAMVKINRKNHTTFCCGSYNRYGTTCCSPHNISSDTLEEIIRNDLNAILQSAGSLRLQNVIAEEQKKLERKEATHPADMVHMENEVYRLTQKKRRTYQDYTEDLISKEDYIQYKERYDNQIAGLQKQLDSLSAEKESVKPIRSQWIERLSKNGCIEKLDRATVVEMVNMIYIYDDNTIKIIYNFTDEGNDNST